MFCGDGSQRTGSFEPWRRGGTVTAHVRVDGRVQGVDVAGILGVLDGAVARIVPLVAVDRRARSRRGRIRACGAGAVRSGARRGA